MRSKLSLSGHVMVFGLIIVALATGLVGLALIVFTSPSGLGPYGVTVWFLDVWLALASGLALGSYTIKKLYKPTDQPRKRLLGSLRQGVLAASWAVVMLALSSLSQLNPRDIILSSILVILIEGYFNLR